MKQNGKMDGDGGHSLMGSRGEGYVVIQFILMVLIAIAPTFLDGRWPEPWDGFGRISGLILLTTGFIFSVVGVLSLGRNLTAVPRPRADANFVGGGAYRIVRHPIYSGIIQWAFGWALWQNSGWIALLAVLLFVLFDIKSRREERWLDEKYAEYAAYSRRVRKLIPFVY